MTTRTVVKNDAGPTGKFVEVTVYSWLAEGVTPENASEYGITRPLIYVTGRWAVLMTNYRLAPGQDQELWIHDQQFYVVSEVS